MGTEEIKGKVGYYNVEKGFGFIKVEGREKDVFFHMSVVNDFDATKIIVGMSVSIVGLEEAEKGYQATGVYID